ncbi:MAG TPA: T9SS type A sorting domain-containing protein [Candidatus Kapabacteria bacterium]|nr:T9SS type A sorting domain-containing protein [Candidatus Kapabacteria bacterium]
MKRTPYLFIILLLIFAPFSVNAKQWNVGPGLPYTAPSKVMGLVQTGDTVVIQSGLYSGDVGFWTKDSLVIYCPNGFAHLDANGKNAGGKGIWVVDGNHTKIINIEFSGVTVPDQNGAGIRLEGVGLELRHCYFHDNDEGVLAGDDPGHDSSDVLFEACEFDHNGFGDGYSHNMYINHLRSFAVRFCYIHRAKVGHNIKSRALNTYIMYNRIMDEADGTASYTIDLPNGGNAYIIGNSIQKGPLAQNHPIITFGEEGLSNPAKQLYVVNNTIVSENPKAVYISLPSGFDSAFAYNNLYYGSGTLYGGYVYTNANVVANSMSGYLLTWHFFDTSAYDFRVTMTGYPALSGKDPGSVNGFSLSPTMQYVHPVDSIVRNNTWGYVGAFDWVLLGVSLPFQSNPILCNYPNPFTSTTTIHVREEGAAGKLLNLTIYDISGKQCSQLNIFPTNKEVIFERGNLQSGIYTYIINTELGKSVGTGKFIIE